MIDGGYFENYGALSALEIARAAKVALKDAQPAVKLVILMISSDPSLEGSHMLVRINEVKDGRKCLVSIAEREPTPAAPASNSNKHSRPPNYFSVDPEEIENALINEFLRVRLRLGVEQLRRVGNALSGWHRKRYAGAPAHEALLPAIWSCRQLGWSVQSGLARVV